MANKFKKALDTRSVKLEKIDKEVAEKKIMDEENNKSAESAVSAELNVKNSTSSHIDNDNLELENENSTSKSGEVANNSIEIIESEKNIEQEIKSSDISKIENDNNTDMNHNEEIVYENEDKKEKKSRKSKKVSRSKSAASDKIPDILAELGIEGKKEYKNKTYYLSVKVVQEISRIAKLKGMSESKLINDLLEKILF